MEDFTFDGLDIAAGTTVHLFAQCAGTDPRAFSPAGFDITAKRKPHFGFGAGIHHCIGHYVARRDMAEALPLLARRMREPAYRRRGQMGCPTLATPARSGCRWLSPRRAELTRPAAPLRRAEPPGASDPAGQTARPAGPPWPGSCAGACASAAVVTSAMLGSAASSAVSARTSAAPVTSAALGSLASSAASAASAGRLISAR